MYGMMVHWRNNSNRKSFNPQIKAIHDLESAVLRCPWARLWILGLFAIWFKSAMHFPSLVALKNDRKSFLQLYISSAKPPVKVAWLSVHSVWIWHEDQCCIPPLSSSSLPFLQHYHHQVWVSVLYWLASLVVQQCLKCQCKNSVTMRRLH